MENNKEKTVEEQIRESELINKVKKDLGDDAAEAVSIFTKMDSDEQDFTLFAVGLKSVCGAEVSDIMVTTTLLKLMMKKDKDLTKAFISSLISIFSKKIINMIDKDTFFNTEDFKK